MGVSPRPALSLPKGAGLSALAFLFCHPEPVEGQNKKSSNKAPIPNANKKTCNNSTITNTRTEDTIRYSTNGSWFLLIAPKDLGKVKKKPFPTTTVRNMMKIATYAPETRVPTVKKIPTIPIAMCLKMTFQRCSALKLILKAKNSHSSN